MKTLPIKMLRDSATLTIPQAVTGWHSVNGVRTVNLDRVHVQRMATLNVSQGYSGEMDDAPTAELWYDVRVSSPRGLNFIDMQNEAVTAGGFMEITHRGIKYRVRSVDELPDTIGGIHHYRLELINA